jgi:sugar/nucleoside kinase (ribokinase family)
MSNDKSKTEDERPLYRSEIFRDRPTPQGGGSGNLSNTIGAEQGIEFFGGDAQPARRARPNKKYLEPAREIPVFAETDVPVVGGGPAGTAAAIAAARLGADVLLVERYNHLG